MTVRGSHHAAVGPMKGGEAPPAQQLRVRGQTGPRTDRRMVAAAVRPPGGSKRPRGVWESVERSVPDMVVGAVLVMLLLVAWRAAELTCQT